MPWPQLGFRQIRHGLDRFEGITETAVVKNPPNASNPSEKALLRRSLLAARRALPAEALAGSARALSRSALGLPELAGARTVAAYVSIGSEPGTRDLLDALRAAGKRVLLPVLLPDNDLDWAVYEGPGSLAESVRPGFMALLEPVGPRLGPEAVTGADAVLLPGLAVDRRGMRLGRGGGSYDRVLARLERAGADPALVVLLYDDEVVAWVPEEPHDHPVQAVATPSGVVRFTASA
ncbi:5-formyltetrahydrofolate cyclo-ligase [Streptomyces sp. WAC05292]|nr:5-formyltetrahydrofolate cyclo-ligase [Streptomyces sp. WAC05292]